MEIANDGPERIEQMPGLRSTPLDPLPAAELATSAAPVFQTLWDEGRPLGDLGVVEDDVALLETVQAGLALSWQLSYQADPAAREREQVALAWARLLLEVRGRDVRRRAKSATLTAELLDRWDEATRQLTGDLRSIGWRLGTDADVPAAARWADAGALDLSEISWLVPSTFDGHPRWACPPLLPTMPPAEAGGRGPRFPGHAQLARPQRAATPWHDLVLTAAWASAGRAPGCDGSATIAARASAERIVETLWSAAGRISDRQCASGLDGPDSALKQAVVEEFWVPIYALADAAFGLAAAPTDAGRAWLAAVTEQLSSFGLVVRAATETEPTRFRQPGLGEAAGRPAMIDLSDGRTVCYGLLPRRGQAVGPFAPPTAARAAQRPAVAAAPVWTVAPPPMPRERNVKVAAGEPAAATATIARAEVREVAATSAVLLPTAKAAEAIAPQFGGAAGSERRAAQSVWHALVCDLFDARLRRSKASLADEALRERLLGIATRIDCRQQELVLDGADDALKQMIADQFWRPLYTLAEATFGLSTKPADAGAAWLEGMGAALAAVQLDVIPPGGGNADAGWFRKPTSSTEPPGRPALIDAATAAVVNYGTYPAGGR